MGLDINICRVTKPGINHDIVHDANRLNCGVISEKDITLPMYNQLLPYCLRIKVVNHYYNIDKLKEEYCLSEAHIGGWSYDQNGEVTVVYGKRMDGRDYHVEINSERFNQKYIADREEFGYAFDRQAVRYWRNAYDIRDWFYDELQGMVENTGYYILDTDIIKKFNETFPDDTITVEAPSGSSALFYWEWY